MQEKQFFVYILMNKYNTATYIGVTSNLEGRLYQHKNKLIDGFTSKYNINKLVYFEAGGDAFGAFEREKQLKKWSRKKKIDLIKKHNKNFDDLSFGWGV